MRDAGRDADHIGELRCLSACCLSIGKREKKEKKKKERERERERERCEGEQGSEREQGRRKKMKQYFKWGC